jgi:hypothetical protein
MLLGALMALSLLAGCGGDDKKSQSDLKKDYAKDYRPINDEFVAVGDQVATTIRTAKGQTDLALATKFDGYAKSVEDLKGRLDDLEPPDEYKPDHEKLSTAMGVVQSDLKAIGTAARDHDGDAAKAAVQKLLKDSENVRTPRRALAEKTGAKTGS